MLNRFLGCTRLDIKKALSVSKKIRNLAKNKLDKVLQIIKQVSAAHKEVPKGNCGKVSQGFYIGLFSMSHPLTGQVSEQRQAA